MIKISINPSFTLIKFKISRVTVTHISRGSRVTIMKQKFMLKFFKYYLAASVLVTDVGDESCW